MATTRRSALVWILLCSSLSILWGSIASQSGNGWVDFRAVYYGTRCLIEGHNPYSVSQLESVYRADGGERPTETIRAHQAVVLYVNMPTTFLFVAPLALLPWGPAHVLWMALIAVVFILASLLMWNVGSRYAPAISLFSLCLLLVNCETIFTAGNTAGLVVGLCVVAVWCFLEERFALVGILCMAASLAIKPHDAGMVWLFFLLAGGVYRKRALQSLLVTAVLGIASFVWLSHVAPHWMQDWNTNLATISAPGGINEPGPSSITGRSSSVVIDLQAAISIFRDDPHFYNSASYLICGALLLAWSVRSLRSRFTQYRAWYALAAIVPLSMLITYHRQWDAKLLMLCIPACAMLWAAGSPIRWVAFIVTTAGLVLTGDIPLALLSILADQLHIGPTGISGKLLMVVLMRPASLALLAMSVFYLWAYLHRTAPAAESGSKQPDGLITAG